ncbi:hypothetical protein ACIQ4Z_09715 [Peribacillus asahii]
MKATITGNDDLSKRILVVLDGRLRVSEIPERFKSSKEAVSF